MREYCDARAASKLQAFEGIKRLPRVHMFPTQQSKRCPLDHNVFKASLEQFFQRTAALPGKSGHRRIATEVRITSLCLAWKRCGEL